MTIRDGGSHDPNGHDPNGIPGRNESFDQAMRELHAQALTQVSSPTRARLRAARTAAARRVPTPGLRWALATGFVSIFALAIGLQWRAPSSSSDAAAQTAVLDAAIDAEDHGAVATFDEDPDFYLWLASNDDTLPATWEQ